MTPECDEKFEEELTWDLENDLRNLANLHQRTRKVSKWELSLGPFIQSRKCMSLKLTGELFVMTMKNDTKIEKELTCQFKTNMRNLTNFDPSTQKSHKLAL